jgi:hypothetical protein
MTDHTATIETLRTAFGSVKKMDPSGAVYAGICDILDRASDDALKAAHAAKIPFVSSLAFNRMIRRGIHLAI